MAISNNKTGIRTGVCTSTTRPTAPYEGQHIYETDTDIEYVWNGSAWVVNYVSAASPAFTGTPTAPTATAGTNTTQLATTAFVTTAAANVTSGFRNVIINGGFDVWQRGTTAAIPSSSSASYLADRWSSYRAAVGSTQSRVAAGLDGFQYALRIKRDNGNSETGAIYVNQSFETSTIAKLANKTVTLSFYARAGANYSSASSLLNARVVAGTGTEANIIYTGVTGSTEPLTTTPTLTTSWQRFTVTGLIPSGTNGGGVYFFYTPTGSASTENDYFEITGVQLEANTVATPFEQRPYGLELALCQRYFSNNQAATFAYGPSTNIGGVVSGFQQMRSAPSIYNIIQGTYAFVLPFVAYYDITSLVVTGLSTAGSAYVELGTNGPAPGQGRPVTLFANVLQLSAEL